MKYFTPELFQRTQPNSPDMDAAHDEWERNIVAYEAELTRLWPSLPPWLRDFLDGVRPHDSTVLFDDLTSDAYRLTILNEGAVTEITYQLTGPPEIETSPWPDDVKSVPGCWLYDEFAAGEPFRHSILFGDGRVLNVLFRNMEVRRLKSVLHNAAES